MSTDQETEFGNRKKLISGSKTKVISQNETNLTSEKLQNI